MVNNAQNLNPINNDDSDIIIDKNPGIVPVEPETETHIETSATEKGVGAVGAGVTGAAIGGAIGGKVAGRTGAVIGAVAGAVAGGLMGQGAAEQTKEMAEKAKPMAQDAANKVKDLAEQAKPKIEEAAHKIEDMADQAKPKIEETAHKLENAAEQAKPKIKDAAHKVEDMADQAKPKIEETANKLENAADQVKPKVEETAHKLENAADNIQPKAQQAADKVKESADKVEGKASSVEADMKKSDLKLFDTQKMSGSSLRGSSSSSNSKPDITLYEERLVANKQSKKAGEVSVGKHVETESAEVSVPVEKEQVIVDRSSPSNKKPVSPGKVDFGSQDIARMEVYEETANIDKQAFVSEEVNIHKDVEKETVTAKDKVRREELDLDIKGKNITEKSR